MINLLCFFLSLFLIEIVPLVQSWQHVFKKDSLMLSSAFLSVVLYSIPKIYNLSEHFLNES